MLLATKTKNAIQKEAAIAGIKASFNLRNITVNGQKRGCSGFVRNTDTGSTVYISTEESCAVFTPPYLYRYAKDSTDLTGYRNRFAKTLSELAASVVEMLKALPTKESESQPSYVNCYFRSV